MEIERQIQVYDLTSIRNLRKIKFRERTDWQLPDAWSRQWAKIGEAGQEA